ncbi:MAG: LacI family transcriptional regulator [Oscillospiraceae bacterium]|nr:LacI family transcriptional regulator [Oscillospiraceae bacterium]
MVSLKMIAEVCGVSVATVSKALNGHKDVKDETREMIRRKADELGYMANSAARMLKTNRSHNLGVLFEDQGGRGLTHEFFATVLEGFKVEAASRGYDITFISKSLLNRSSSYLQHCKYRGFDGVGIICVKFRDADVLELVESDIPVVTVDHEFEGHSAVLSDNITGIAALVKYAYEKGHRKIAYIHGEETYVTEKRLQSFRTMCNCLELLTPNDYIRQGMYYEPDVSYRETLSLLQLEDRPTCIIYPDDFSMIGGINAVRDAGLRFPEDISIMGYDGIDISQVMNPRITTYQQNAGALGRAAAAKLIESIENPESSICESINVSGRLLEGASVVRPCI